MKKFDPEPKNINKINPVETEKDDTIIRLSADVKIPTQGNENVIDCLKSIDKTLKNMWNVINEKQTEEEREIKWKYAAIVFDRLFLYIVFLYFLLTFGSLILSIPNLYRGQ